MQAECDSINWHQQPSNMNDKMMHHFLVVNAQWHVLYSSFIPWGKLIGTLQTQAAFWMSLQLLQTIILCTVFEQFQGPLLLTLINFNPSMDK